MQIHALIFSKREMLGSQKHIKYLNSLKTWNQLCGQQVHEEKPEKKTGAQWKEKLGQDQRNPGGRREG